VVLFCPTETQWELKSTLPFTPSFLCNPKFPTIISACHLLSRWYLARLILPQRYRRYIPPKRRFTFNGLHDVTSQMIVPFKCIIIIVLLVKSPEQCFKKWTHENSMSYSLRDQIISILTSCGKFIRDPH
jgi:hypothetical protein